MEKIEKKLVIINRDGLHARAASVLVQTCEKFDSNILLEKDDYNVNGKSILGVMSLGAPRGTEIKFKIEGDDAKDALESIEKVIGDKFGEEQ